MHKIIYVARIFLTISMEFIFLFLKTELYKQVRFSFSGSHVYMQIIVEQSETIVHRPLGLQAMISLLYSRTIMITLSQNAN